jgi:hypothetical protein
MLIYLISFVVILVVSFILALKSMKDYDKKTHFSESRGSLYLIRNPKAISEQLIQELSDLSLKHNTTFAIERLFKGQKSALVIFGKSNLLTNFPSLDLLELEDYVHNHPNISDAWSVNPVGNRLDFGLDLSESDQVWWQVVIGRSKDQKKTKTDSYQLMLDKSGKKMSNPTAILAQARAVFLIEEPLKLQPVAQQFEKMLHQASLSVLSKNIKIADDYIVRNLKSPSSLTATQVVNLLV